MLAPHALCMPILLKRTHTQARPYRHSRGRGRCLLTLAAAAGSPLRLWRAARCTAGCGEETTAPQWHALGLLRPQAATPYVVQCLVYEPNCPRGGSTSRVPSPC